MLKKTLITLAVAAKAIALTAAVLLSWGSQTANAEDCPMLCIPPPCPDFDCGEGEES